MFVLPNAGVLNFHPRDCLARRIFPPAKTVCADSRAHFLLGYDRFRAAIEPVLAEFPQVRVFDLSAMLCDETQCRAIQDNTLLFRNSGHLSNDGSDLVAEKLWSEMVIR